jgi:NhaA family Na+:H+ antiporter
MKLLHRFFSSEASGGVILIIAAAAAMVLANLGITRISIMHFWKRPLS